MSKVLTRIEGEAEVLIIEENNVVSRVVYNVTEAPRFFEYLIKGMELNTVADIVSRICGLCGVSYSLVAAKAFERCLEVDVSEEVELFREALHLVERIKSHIIHVFFLNLPDLVYTGTSIDFTRRNPRLAKAASHLILWSRKAMEMFGGRFHNVVNIRIGGVYKMPSREDVEKLRRSINEAMEMFKLFADFVLSLKNIPEEPQQLSLASLYTENSYPHIGSKIRLEDEIYDIGEFYGKIVEVIQKPYSNALHYRLRSGESYIVGPISRFNNFYSRLTSETREFIESYGWKAPLKNIQQSIVARIAETLEALHVIKNLMENYKYVEPSLEKPQVNQCESLCEAAIEAPRGILYHRYEIDQQGRVVHSNIITPTAQNLAAMEDMATSLLKGHKISEKIVDIAKRIPIAFDPCISCSVHSIPIKIVKEPISSF
ncbi:MAG: nickel-dependent hydrogenase large subunit [Ignisphaera sp.]|uniref:Ni/Fe hydrogenase subunit alpha n=1 Tax=Ignisphaera aggregans TaxID=334771 RepID=A0A7C4NLY8_9CREN